MTDPGKPDQEVIEWRPGVHTRLHACRRLGSETLAVIEQWCAINSGAPLHTHFDVEEVIYISRGEAEFSIDTIVRHVGSGETILLPPQSWHSFRNVGTGTLQAISVFASPEPLVCYADEPNTVLAVGGSGEMLDRHRAKISNEPPTFLLSSRDPASLLS